jgi:hypothetical protein
VIGNSFRRRRVERHAAARVCLRPRRQAALGLGRHLGKRSLLLALAIAHRSRGVPLLAGER